MYKIDIFNSQKLLRTVASLLLAFSVTDAFGAHVSVPQPDISEGSVWRSPLQTGFKVTEAFVKPETRYTAGHRGIDLQAEIGESVYSPVDGIVHFSGVVVDRPLVTIRLFDETLLSLEPVLGNLKTGDRVSWGQEIGKVDTGAHCSAQCIHVGVRIDGEYVNPMFFFGKKPTLLPL